jgi:hypothetical protein
LLKKGFVKDESHHEMFWLVVDGKKRATKKRISHGEKEAGDFLQHQMAKQMNLSHAEFLSFVECTIDGPRYAKLIDRRAPRPERFSR